jgi:uncharacterized membrane protein YqaE (UPF0057 family)
MRYILAFLLPPVAILLCGRPFLAVLSILFTLCFWVPGIILALIVVGQANADRRNRELIRAVQRQG